MTNTSIPNTNEERIEVLEKALEIVKTNWSSSFWIEVVDGTENYCLYGAVEKAMGVDFKDYIVEAVDLPEEYEDEDIEWDNYDAEFSKLDKLVNKCNLTETMYKASMLLGHETRWSKALAHLAEGDENKAAATLYPLAHPKNAKESFERFIKDGTNKLMTTHLQGLNDSGSRNEVIAILEEAIRMLKAGV